MHMPKQENSVAAKRTPALEGDLGRLTALMLSEMSSRGPDSAGFAVYSAPGATRISALSRTGDTDWSGYASRLQSDLKIGVEGFLTVRQ